MPISPDLNIPLRHVFADANMVEVVLPPGTKYVRVLPILFDAFLSFQGIDGDPLGASFETVDSNTEVVRAVSGKLLIAGSSSRTVEITPMQAGV